LRLPLRALSSSCSADPQPTVLPALSLPDALPICDIGGTNARFALVREGEVQPQAIEVLPCSDYVNLDAAIVDYLRRAGVEAVGQACLAVASPVQGTQVRMTNNHWRFDIEDVRQQFGWSAFKVDRKSVV